jgi:hypothetical protein
MFKIIIDSLAFRKSPLGDLGGGWTDKLNIVPVFRDQFKIKL